MLSALLFWALDMNRTLVRSVEDSLPGVLERGCHRRDEPVDPSSPWLADSKQEVERRRTSHRW